MQYSFMDKLLIDIYNIRNIQSIQVSDIVLPIYKNTKSMIIPCLMVEYDGGKMITLCAKDKYFDIFVKKTIEVYNDEKDHIFDDDLIDPFKLHREIKIDEHTKEIFENGELLKNLNMLSFYEGKESYPHSLLFSVDTITLLLPIIDYHLKKELASMKMNLVTEGNLKGYRNRYSLNGKVNGIPTSILLSCDLVDNNKYHFEVGGILSKNTPIIIEISFMNESINVKLTVDKYNLESNYTYLINNGMIKEINEASVDGKTIYYKNNDLEKVTADSFSSLVTFDGRNDFTWFKLPWNAYYGTFNNTFPLSSIENNIESGSVYLSYSKKGFIKLEHYMRKYKRSQSSQAMGQVIALDERIKNTKGICLSSNDNTYLIETTFLDAMHMNGYYNENLKNHYFYHLAKCDNGIENIKGDELVSIGPSDGTYSYSDIKNHDLVLKRVRGNN